MDVQPQIEGFMKFIETDYFSKLKDNLRKDKSFLKIDFNDLAKFNNELADVLLECPEDTIKASELAIHKLLDDTYKNINVRFYNLPKTAHIGIGEIRKEHFDGIFQFEGLIIKAGDITACADVIKYECPSCLPKGTLVLNSDGKFRPIEESYDVISIDNNFIQTTKKTIIKQTGRRQIWKINNEIECSGEHKWFVYRKGITSVVQTKDLNKGDILYRINYGKPMHNMWEETQQPKENLFRRLQKKIQKCVSNRWGEGKVRQQEYNSIIHATENVHSPNCKIVWNKPQINKKKIVKVQDTIEISLGTSKDKHKELRKETLEVSKRYSKSLIQAWETMWSKEKRHILQRIGEEGKNNEMRGMQCNKPLKSSSQGFKSFQQQKRESSDTLSILPFKVTLVNKTREEVEMYDLQVPDYHNFILSNGVITHNCGQILTVLQLDEDKLKQPSRCGCGRKGKFREISKTWKNVQHIIVEEYITDYTDKKAKPTTVRVILEHDLANEKLTKQLQPGKHIRFVGIVQPKQIGISTFFAFRVLCNHMIVEDISLFNLKIPQKYIKQFKEMKNNPDLLTDISESIFFGIEGQTTVKKILAISRARGVKSYHQDGKLDQRDTINVLMVGNPGSAKSDMGKMAIKVDVIGMVVSGKGVSGVGLTSTTLYDKELSCYCVEPGAVPRTNNGSIFIDEGDKIDSKDLSALNEAMVDLSFMTVKANQQVRLPADTNIIMAVNPEGRKFDTMIDKYRQITLKPDFLDRFDIWISVDKVVETDKQKRVIGKITDRFGDDKNKMVGKYNLQFIQYYYAWVIQNFKPRIPNTLKTYIAEEISKLMNQAGKDERNSDISYRLVGNIIRFAIAIAKLHQENEITKDHINLSIELQKYGFKSLDMLDETGQVSVEKIQHEIPVAITRKKYDMETIIKELFDENKGAVLIENVIKRWEEEGNDVAKGEEIIEKLLTRGRCFSPRNDLIRPI